MKKLKWTCTLPGVLALLLAAYLQISRFQAVARIVESGIWTNLESYDTTLYYLNNGIPVWFSPADT